MARPKKAKRGISKLEAVRQAVAKLGKGAKPAEILDFLKTNFGIEMSAAMASNYKSTALQEAKGKRKGRKPGRKPAAVSANGRRSGGITLEDIHSVKALADRIGAEKVGQLAAVLAK